MNSGLWLEMISMSMTCFVKGNRILLTNEVLRVWIKTLPKEQRTQGIVSFNFIQNLGQALAFFLFGKGWEIHVTPMTNQTFHFNIIQFLVKFQMGFVCQRARNTCNHFNKYMYQIKQIYVTTLMNPTIHFNIIQFLIKFQLGFVCQRARNTCNHFDKSM